MDAFCLFMNMVFILSDYLNITRYAEKNRTQPQLVGALTEIGFLTTGFGAPFVDLLFFSTTLS